jgi:hypothetical protein
VRRDADHPVRGDEEAERLRREARDEEVERRAPEREGDVRGELEEVDGDGLAREAGLDPPLVQDGQGVHGLGPPQTRWRGISAA